MKNTSSPEKLKIPPLFQFRAHVSGRSLDLTSDRPTRNVSVTIDIRRTFKASQQTYQIPAIS